MNDDFRQPPVSPHAGRSCPLSANPSSFAAGGEQVWAASAGSEARECEQAVSAPGEAVENAVGASAQTVPTPSAGSEVSNRSRFVGRHLPRPTLPPSVGSARPLASTPETSERETSLPPTKSAVPSNSSESPAPPAASASPFRRPHLHGFDGLRAIAVVLVLIYHFLPQYLPGGNNGVDVFFVLSGFLITGLLVAEKRQTGRINLPQFWLRRVRRLVPAVGTMLLVTASVAALIGGDVLVGLQRQFWSALAWVANWGEIFSGTSYFDQSSPQLYSNMWSLAVEEQFYLVWPFLLLVSTAVIGRGRLTRVTRRRLTLGALTLALLSAAWAALVLFSGAPTSRAYYGTDTHCYGLMLGAALALWDGKALMPREKGDDPRAVSRRELWARGLAGWAGLAGVICVAYTVSAEDALMTPWGLLLSSAFTVALLQSLLPENYARSGPGRALAKLLDLAPLRWIGQRSYGIYLWHWPLYVLAFYLLPFQVGRVWMALVLGGASVGLAHLSLRYIENPIRRQGFIRWVRALTRRARYSLLIAVLLTCALTAFGFYRAPALTTAQLFVEQGSGQSAPAQTEQDPTPNAPRKAAPSETARRPEKPEAARKQDPAQAQSAEKTPDSQPAPLLPAPDPSPVPAPASESPSAPNPSELGSRVLAIGDSVMLASKGALEEALPGIVIDAEVSRSFVRAISVLQAADQQFGARPIVVVGLATNSTLKKSQLVQLLDALGPERKLVLVNTFLPPRYPNADPNNALLNEVANEHPGRVAVANWHDAIAPHTDYLARDLYHPGKAGAQIYAQTVLEAVKVLAGTR